MPGTGRRSLAPARRRCPRRRGEGHLSVNFDRVKDAVRKLTTEILTMQAEGSYEKAKALLDRYGVIRPAMQKALDRMGDVPVDIEPIFPLAKKK